MLVGFYSQIEARGESSMTLVGIHLFEQAVIVPSVDDDSDVPMIFCRGADHGGTANINVFDRLLKTAIGACNRRFKGIKIDDDHVNGGNTVSFHNAIVGASAAQKTTVDGGV